MTPRALALTCLLSLSLTPLGASATVVEPLSTEALVARSSSIVRGRVERLDVVDVQGRFVTRVTLSVSDVLKGPSPAGAQVIVETLGGTRGPISQRVAGEARFTVGEDVVVCLEAVAGRLVVLGMALGKFTVEPTSGGASRLRRDVGELEFGPVPDGGAPTHTAVPTELPLDALRDPATTPPALAPRRP